MNTKTDNNLTLDALIEDGQRFRFLMSLLQDAYDGDCFESDLLAVYCRMSSQRKGERRVSAEIFWTDKTDCPIDLRSAIDRARDLTGREAA